MLCWLAALAFADDVRPPTPTRVTPGAADVHLELPAGFAKYKGPTGDVLLQGPMQVDLYDGWMLVRMTETGQISAVPREQVVYVGTNNPNLAAPK